jgi:aminoglycoside phosphotransferase (APT) family kinase protein
VDVSDLDVVSLVDRDRLATIVGEITPVDDGIEVAILSGGRSNLTFVVTAGGRELVARRRPLGTVPAGAHDMAREHRVLSALRTSTLPVPRVYGFYDDESIMGAPFYLMDRVHGTVLDRRQDVAALTPQQCHDLSAAAVDALAQLHAIDYVAVGLGDLGRPDGFVARRLARWLQQWDNSPHRDHPSVHLLGERLQAQVPVQADSTLVHGDFRLGNMIIDLEGPAQVAAILDWEMSTLGDPCTDLAHMLVYWEPSRGRLTHSSQEMVEQTGFLTGAELTDRYAAATGRALGSLDFYLAFEHWRAAIIKEGIFVRHQEVGDGDGDVELIGESVALHLDEAADLLGYAPAR